jgi:hypothetical protein
MPGLLSREHTFVVAISDDTVPSSFGEGIEFEETFPESEAPALKPAPTTAGLRPTVIGDNEAPRRDPPAPAPRREPAMPTSGPAREPQSVRPAPAATTPPASVASTPAPVASTPNATKRSDMSDAAFEERLEKRMRNAEALVRETIEHARVEEEKRLAIWAKGRRDEEERRLAAWVAERRAEIEKNMEIEHRTDTDALKSEIQRMLVDWQTTFEQRFRSELAAAIKSAAQREMTAPQARSDARAAITIAPSARDVGRILRDQLADIAESASFALALHHESRDEVVYRYRVASEDEVGATLRRDALDDGPQSAVAHMDEWVRGQRVVRVGERNVLIHSAQYAVRDGDTTIGVVSLQSANEALRDDVLRRFAALIEIASARLAELRGTGSFRR